MERALSYEIKRQTSVLDQGMQISQETLGWNETEGITYSQRSKEEAHDYRYFPEPDLPPLVVDPEWIENIMAKLPELPRARRSRLQHDYGLSPGEARNIAAEMAVAEYFEQTVQAAGEAVPARSISTWISGELFAWMNRSGENIQQIKVNPTALAELIKRMSAGEITVTTAKTVLTQMLHNGQSSGEIIASGGLEQISATDSIAELVRQVLEQNPTEVTSYLAGKTTLMNWFFGQVMRSAGGTANPHVVETELDRQLSSLRK
jgi:aspartyl-tRNA(Asn)/glutamyl-tRNA(Gln) amidotransferase subunit B